MKLSPSQRVQQDQDRAWLVEVPAKLVETQVELKVFPQAVPVQVGMLMPLVPPDPNQLEPSQKLQLWTQETLEIPPVAMEGTLETMEGTGIHQVECQTLV